jgi:two-component system, chemotaxis family, protein-glutamate methylesterase/glutaminase
MSGKRSTERSPSKPAVVVVGCSLGGYNALGVILRALPRDYPLPIAIVQHRGVEQSERLQVALQELTALPVREVDDKEPIVPGCIYVAPPDYHLLVEVGRFALSTDARVLAARPSIDMLFESAADAYLDRVVAVVLTGASRDGAQGATRVKRKGGIVVVQEPSTAESRVMPDAAIAACAPDRVLPLEGIAAFLQVQGYARI